MRSRGSRGGGPAVLVIALLLVALSAAEAPAQSVKLPVAGPYPGGHVGLLGGSALTPGWDYVAFVRSTINHDYKGDDGNTIASDDATFMAWINYFVWSPKRSVLGGVVTGIGLLTWNETLMRPYDDQSRQSSGWGLGNCGALALWSRKYTAFDFQAGLGLFLPTGSFDPGDSTATNHGGGFTTWLPTFGGAWYPGGNRMAWNVSAVARIELCGTQKDTDIKVGDAIVIDWGAGRIFEIGSTSKHWFNAGISGFLEYQLAEQSGPLPSDSLPKYKVFGLGGEIHWMLPKRHLSFLARVQEEFGAKNTSESTNLWFNGAYSF